MSVQTFWKRHHLLVKTLLPRTLAAAPCVQSKLRTLAVREHKNMKDEGAPFFWSPHIYTCSGIGWGRSSLKPGKISLQPAQMKCNDKPQEAELSFEKKYELLIETSQNL
jgi:hypothetical protein